SAPRSGSGPAPRERAAPSRSPVHRVRGDQDLPDPPREVEVAGAEDAAERLARQHDGGIRVVDGVLPHEHVRAGECQHGDEAARMGLLGTETAFEVLVRARELERQGRDVVHLEIGEPDFDTPAHVKEAAKQALDEGWTHYGAAAGLPELREAIADHVARTRGIAVDRPQAVVTPGAKPAPF